MDYLNCLIIICISYMHTTGGESRSEANSIAEQLGFGIKRTVYYLDTLLEKCDNVVDLNQWILFMDSHLKCDAEANPKKYTQSLDEDDALGRVSAVCAAWQKRRKCSSRLASKLNSCLDSKLEDGKAGSNALRLSDAHLKFICHHKHEYIKNLDTGHKNDVILPVEKRPLACFWTMKEYASNCISEKNRLMSNSESTFCEKFNLAKECLSKASVRLCKHHAAKRFLHTMLKQLQSDIQCSPTNSN